MALIKKLTKYGNCFALVIDRPILNLLGIEVDTPLEITTPDGKRLEIKPVKSAAADDGGQQA